VQITFSDLNENQWKSAAIDWWPLSEVRARNYPIAVLLRLVVWMNWCKNFEMVDDIAVQKYAPYP